MRNWIIIAGALLTALAAGCGEFPFNPYHRLDIGPSEAHATNADAETPAGDSTTLHARITPASQPGGGSGYVRLEDLPAGPRSTTLVNSSISVNREAPRAAGQQTVPVPLADGRVIPITAPEGATVEVWFSQANQKPPLRSGTDSSDAAQGRIFSRLNDITLKDYLAANTQLGPKGARSSAGGFDFSGVNLLGVGGTTWLVIVGGIMVAAGIFVAIKFNRGLGIALALAGLGMAAVAVLVAQFAWLLVLLLLVGLVGVAVWYAWTHTHVLDALKTVVAGVENSSAAAVVKESIGKAVVAAGTSIKNLVRKTKAKAVEAGLISGQPSASSGQPAAISGQPSAVSGQPSAPTPPPASPNAER